MSRPLPQPRMGQANLDPGQLDRTPPMKTSSWEGQQPSGQPTPAATNDDKNTPEEHEPRIETPMETDPLGAVAVSEPQAVKQAAKPITTTTTATATATVSTTVGVSKTGAAASSEGKAAPHGENATKGATAAAGEESTTDLDLLLLGKSGVGKSATGNTILQRKVFKSSASLTSVTDKICADVAKVKNRIVKVVDGPGVGDTRMDTDQGIQFFIESIKQAMFSNPSGYHALLLVLRYGSRLTKEDSDTVKLLKEVFGKDFLKKYGVIIITCGDNFKSDAEEDEFTFPEWLSEQTGLMEDLRKECNDRVVLLDNITKDETEKSEQMDKLLKMIDKLDNGGKRYSDENFRRTKEAREKVMVESREPMARDKTLETLSLLLQELREINENFKKTDDPVTTASDLETLHEKLRDLIKDIHTQDRGTGALKNLMESIETVEKSVSTSLGFYRRMAEERQNERNTAEELKTREETINKQYEATLEDAEKRALQAERDSLKLQLEKERLKHQMEREKHQEDYLRAQVMLEEGTKRFDEYRIYQERSIFTRMKDKMTQVFGPVLKIVTEFIFGTAGKNSRLKL